MSWTQKTLGEIVNLKRGFDLPSSSRVDGPYPVFSSSGQTGTHSEAAVKGPCVVTGRYGTIGQVFFSDAACWPLNTSLYSTDFKGNDPKFVYYLLKTIPWRDYLTASAVPGINRNHVHLCPVCVPDHETQTAISGVLGLLDNKIELNTKLNGYLEELLLAKYDKLFPVNADFTGILSDVGTIIGGATPSKKRSEYYCSNGIGWITPRDLSNTSDKFIAHGTDDITYEGYASCSAKLLPKGSVLFSSRAPIGYIAIAADAVATNQGFKSIVPKEEIGTAFVYCFLVRNKQRIADMGAGTTFPEVSGKMMKSVELAIPEQTLCAEFDFFAGPILKQQEALERENRELAALRDALLPKLMSGEIDVSQVDLTQINSHLAKSLRQFGRHDSPQKNGAARTPASCPVALTFKSQRQPTPLPYFPNSAPSRPRRLGFSSR